MGEPWLDSLSEDWNSEPRLSSPASSLANSRYGTQNSRLSQSRIPHLAQSMRRDTASGSFLKPRSTRGIAKSKGIPVLSERSASSLNVLGTSARDASTKRVPSTTVSRKASSNFSDSQQSVQHHTVDNSMQETPEWKKRIQSGEDVASDGFDLFSPSKLEGMFVQPTQSTPNQENEPSLVVGNSKPWTSLKPSNIKPPVEQYQSFRTSRSRAPPMESLPELSENEDDSILDHSMSAISSDLARQGSLRGLVRRRVSDLESPRQTGRVRSSGTAMDSQNSYDPRWRTLSGQQELRNEDISSVTVSTKNTISARAVRESVELNPEILKKKLMDARSSDAERPSSSSSDRDVSYAGKGLGDEDLLHEELLPDITAHSLPDDLSMGTQDFISHRGFVNTRRGVESNDTSFFKKKLSSVNESSQLGHDLAHTTKFRSSPPPYDTTKTSSVDQNKDETQLPSSPQDESVVHHEPTLQHPNSAGSPLKLFGNRDTYTNNKLLRVLSQYEQDKSDHSKSSEEVLDESIERQQTGNELRMSQFGKGELDSYHFQKEIERPTTTETDVEMNGEKIFQSFADLSIEDEGTIPGIRPFIKDNKDQEFDDPTTKRMPSSPEKDRTSKRRRTLLQDEIIVGGADIEVKVSHIQEQPSLAGKKRKDARPGGGVVKANPEVLESRSILRPMLENRKSSGQSQNRSTSQDSTIKRTTAPGKLAEALAAELASFAHEVSEAHHDSRKPSLATRDYMEEANKVMEFIRARGKPKPQLPNIEEPMDLSELDADRILDLEIEDDSTVEPFSRPPSREGAVKPPEDRRIAKHDPQIAHHLQKFKDSDDLELIGGTSVVGTLHLVNNLAASETPLPTLAEDDHESSPPNMRILNEGDTQRKRKHSASSNIEQSNASQSLNSSARRTLASETSNSSGNKGIINSGKVAIPDNVGTMTFDHEKQIWIKQNLIKAREQRQVSYNVEPERDEVTLEDDPFGDIPDLSVDEQHEAAMRVFPNSSSRPSTADTVQLLIPSRSHEDITRQPDTNVGHKSENADSHHANEPGQREGGARSGRAMQQRVSGQSEASKHEERLHQGIPSKAPVLPGTPKMQPRVVTIAFSSPVASEIPQPVKEIFNSTSDDEDFLPPDDSDDDIEYLTTPKTAAGPKLRPAPTNKSISLNVERHLHRPLTLSRRPVSRIGEADEDAEPDEGLSLIHVKQPQLATPAAANQVATMKPASAYKGASILCLTPLSEFTMHQADRANHPEESFVQERAHPKALLQAHGALALSVDTLIKAITDSIPDEPFWEQLRKLDLKDSRLQSTHGLQDYCPGLEALDISHNQVAQLDGLPSSLRELNISSNKVNDFTSWGRLHDLQYVDVSNNELENLEGFSSLIHMRRLKSSSNSLKDIEGVLDLDGLISLDVQNNQLSELDFEGVDLPRLEELNLSNNKLTTVRNLQCMPQLKKLDLSDNDLRELHLTEPMSCLKYLAISRNQLETLDLAMFPALTELSLDGNRIRTIDGLSSALQLRRMSVRDQQDSSGIVDLVLSTPNECSEIFVSSNALSRGQMKLPRYPQYNLRHLEIAACGLQALPAGFGDYFPNCRSLNLNFNAISELSPLLGSIKLQEVLVAGNRIKRLRRTCLTLSRMPLLANIDLRNNPLTVGFYAHQNTEPSNIENHLLPQRSKSQDLRWLQLLDETTSLKRKMIELLLAEGCPTLKEVDGLPFNRDHVRERDAVWDNLTCKGVLVRAIEAPPAQIYTPSVVEMPVNNNLSRIKSSLIADNDDNDGIINMNGVLQERSLVVG